MDELQEDKRLLKDIGATSEIEIIDEMGQENERQGAKATIAVSDALERQAERSKTRELERLEKSSRHRIVDYQRLLAEIFDKRCREQEFPLPWQYHIQIVDRGIGMYILYPGEAVYARGFKPCGEPQYDYNALDKIIESAWVQINKRPGGDNPGIIKP